MAISKSSPLLCKDLYFYDFKSAFPRIMNEIDWDFSNVDLDNKYKRNIEVGLAQRDNENLSSYLNHSVTGMLEYYMRLNGITVDDIIISQKDGFISTKRLVDTTSVMELDFRGMIDILIITPDRRKYMTISGKDVDVKGVSNYYSKLDKIYSLFAKFNFFHKGVLFNQFQNIKNAILQETDKRFFMIPLGDEKAIQSHNGPLIVTSKKSFAIEDIAKHKYFDHYFKEFIDAIFIETY